MQRGTEDVIRVAYSCEPLDAGAGTERRASTRTACMLSL